MRWTTAGGTRRRDPAKKTWRRTFQVDLGRVHLTWNEAEDMAYRSYWRQAAAQCALQDGGTKYKSKYDHIVCSVID